MGTENWWLVQIEPAMQEMPRPRRSWLLSTVLVVLGLLFLLAAIGYASFALLQSWLMQQDRYLLAHDVAPLPVALITWTPSPAPLQGTSTAAPTLSPTAGLALALATATATASPSPTPRPTLTSTPPATLTPIPTPTPSPTELPTDTPSPSPSPVPSATPTPTPASPPAQIRIPALNINRGIVSLPRVRDADTGAWTWKTDGLFRSGRRDLVGHWVGSGDPGLPGNTVLVGHNFGYGFNGVFVYLHRLKPGNKVHIVNKAGETFTYQVTEVKRVKWRTKTLGELSQHLAFLSTSGPERLTLVSCAGADFEPFPERVYVVAEPLP